MGYTTAAKDGDSHWYHQYFRGRAMDEWSKIEAQTHNQEYANAFPFGLKTFEFTVERALWYEDYAFKPGRRSDRGDRTKKFLELLQLDSIAGKQVLDIGCGIGQYAVLCAKMGAYVTGVELSPVGIQRAQEIAAANGVADRCNFIVGNFMQQELPSEHFDIVYMHEVLHHAVKYPGLSEKTARVIKPGGRILIADGVRGDSLVDAGRRLVKHFRFRGRPSERQEDENKGDVPLVLQDIRDFACGFPRHEIYFMNYLYMIKEVDFLRMHRHYFATRFLLRMIRYADALLLGLLPFLRKHCSEVILYIET